MSISDVKQSSSFVAFFCNLVFSFHMANDSTESCIAGLVD